MLISFFSNKKLTINENCSYSTRFYKSKSMHCVGFNWFSLNYEACAMKVKQINSWKDYESLYYKNNTMDSWMWTENRAVKFLFFDIT